MEDVINQSSNYNLKFWSIFILIQPNSRVPQRSKFWPPPIQTRSLIFMTVRTQQVNFPTSFCLGRADKFLAVQCVCRGHFGNRLVASLCEQKIVRCMLYQDFTGVDGLFWEVFKYFTFGQVVLQYIHQENLWLKQKWENSDKFSPGG